MGSISPGWISRGDVDHSRTPRGGRHRHAIRLPGQRGIHADRARPGWSPTRSRGRTALSCHRMLLRRESRESRTTTRIRSISHRVGTADSRRSSAHRAVLRREYPNPAIQATNGQSAGSIRGGVRAIHGGETGIHGDGPICRSNSFGNPPRIAPTPHQHRGTRLHGASRPCTQHELSPSAALSSAR